MLNNVVLNIILIFCFCNFFLKKIELIRFYCHFCKTEMLIFLSTSIFRNYSKTLLLFIFLSIILLNFHFSLLINFERFVWKLHSKDLIFGFCENFGCWFWRVGSRARAWRWIPYSKVSTLTPRCCIYSHFQLWYVSWY